MKRRVVLRVLAISGIAGLLILAAGWAVASNMGFKLNFGVVNAVNQLLYGSGVSLATVTDDNVPAKTSLVVGLDLAHQKLAPQNSNMGFKLLVASLPEGGIEVIDPAGNSRVLTWDGSDFSLTP